jgi:hypothetical protein
MRDLPLQSTSCQSNFVRVNSNIPGPHITEIPARQSLFTIRLRDCAPGVNQKSGNAIIIARIKQYDASILSSPGIVVEENVDQVNLTGANFTVRVSN